MTKEETLTNEISIEGRINVDNSDDMRRKLSEILRSKPQTIKVDLSKVISMDSSGLATLLEATAIARRQNTRLILQGIRGQLRYMLEISRLDRLFDIEGEMRPA